MYIHTQIYIYTHTYPYTCIQVIINNPLRRVYAQRLLELPPDVGSPEAVARPSVCMHACVYIYIYIYIYTYV